MSFSARSLLWAALLAACTPQADGERANQPSVPGKSSSPAARPGPAEGGAGGTSNPVAMPSADAAAAAASDAALAGTPPVDAGNPAVADAAADALGPGAGAADGPPAGAGDPAFTCTLILGTNQTGEWFNAGFETLVDGAKWELVKVHSAFVELWAQPNNGIWSSPVGSRCSKNADMPDRVIFLALATELEFYPLDKWLPLLQSVVKNIQAKYAGVQRIELMTYVRAPMNMPCPGAPPQRSQIGAAQDQAMAMVAQANPGLVTVAPPFAARSCADFGGTIPHSTPAAAKAWAETIAKHYGLGR